MDDCLSCDNLSCLLAVTERPVGFSWNCAATFTIFTIVSRKWDSSLLIECVEKRNRIIARHYKHTHSMSVCMCVYYEIVTIFTVTYFISSSVWRRDKKKSLEFWAFANRFHHFLPIGAFHRIHFICIYLFLFTIAWASMVWCLWCLGRCGAVNG